LGGLDLGNFIELMIAELSNQDPLNPMENSDILQQVSQIREIDATDHLTKTLDSVLTGQNLSSASSLIGKQVEALSDLGSNIEGTVDSVTIADGVVKIHVGQQTVSLSNLRRILGSAETGVAGTNNDDDSGEVETDNGDETETETETENATS
jgi:flagellar basal-body rod modification protein FlgD